MESPTGMYAQSFKPGLVKLRNHFFVFVESLFTFLKQRPKSDILPNKSWVWPLIIPTGYHQQFLWPNYVSIYTPTQLTAVIQIIAVI